ncbi:MAG: TonB family protein [Myxococcota bacterium]|jgi:TonB family protein
MVLAGVVYATMGVAVAVSPEPKAPELPEPEPVEVRVFSKDIQLKKPPVIEKRKPDPPREEPKPEPPPEVVKETPKVVPLKTETPPTARQPAPKRPPRAKPGNKPRKPSKSKAPPQKKTVVLSTAVTGGGGPKAYVGGDDVFGNPEQEFSEQAARPDTGPKGKGSPDSRGTGRGKAAPSGTGKKPGKPKFVAPKVRRKVKGAWPDNAPRTGRPVTVTLSLRIDDKGSVVSARVVMKPARAGKFFDREAKRVAKKTRFSPAKRGGVPIAYTIRYAVVFTL